MPTNPSSFVVIAGERVMNLKALCNSFFPEPTMPIVASWIFTAFMRVNTRLLKRNGIATLRFDDERFITDAEFRMPSWTA